MTPAPVVSDPPTTAAGTAAADLQILAPTSSGLRLPPYIPAPNGSGAGAGTSQGCGGSRDGAGLESGSPGPSAAAGACPTPAAAIPDVDWLLAEIDYLEESGLLTEWEALLRRHWIRAERLAWLADMCAWLEAGGC